MFVFLEIALELTGSQVPYAGRVKVRYQGVWGTFCADEWQHEITEVICRQLGFDGVELDITLNNLDEYSPPKVYDVGPGPVWFRSSGCKGHEKHLSECDLTEDRYCIEDNVELICKMDNVSVNGKRFRFVRMCCDIKERSTSEQQSPWEKVVETVVYIYGSRSTLRVNRLVPDRNTMISLDSVLRSAHKPRSHVFRIFTAK